MEEGEAQMRKDKGRNELWDTLKRETLEAIKRWWVEPRSHTADWPGPRRYGFAQHEYLALSDLRVAGDPCLTLWL